MRLTSKTDSMCASAGQSQDALTEHLMTMGFSSEAIRASRDATGSSEIGVLVDWLHSHPYGSGHGDAIGSAATVNQDPRYPALPFGHMSDPLRSHPVQGFLTADDDSAIFGTGHPYDQHPPVPSANVSAQATGMEAIVAVQRAKASKIREDVQSGFRDLQVQFLLCSGGIENRPDVNVCICEILTLLR